MNEKTKLDTRTQNLLIQCRQSIAASIEDAGGCDHDTGICMCADISLIDQIDRMIFEQERDRMPWAFFHAEPTHSYGNRAAGFEWARQGHQKMLQFLTEELHKIANPEEE